ncbi:hypothetical protein [Gordonia sp. p3-SID1431]|nr:hypothetical protein [Gordonia sp. p3-SID1431]
MTDDLRAMIASRDGVFTTHQAHSHGVSADGIGSGPDSGSG